MDHYAHKGYTCMNYNLSWFLWLCMNYWSLLLTHQNSHFDYKHTFIYDFSHKIYLYPFIQDLTWSNFGNHWSWLTYRTCHQIIQILNVLINLFWNFIIVHKTKRHKYIYILSIQYEFAEIFTCCYASMNSTCRLMMQQLTSVTRSSCIFCMLTDLLPSNSTPQTLVSLDQLCHQSKDQAHPYNPLLFSYRNMHGSNIKCKLHLQSVLVT